MKNKVQDQPRLTYESPIFQVYVIEHENCIAAASLPKENVSTNSISHKYEEEQTQNLDLFW